MFSETTFTKLITDQSKLVFPSECFTLYYIIGSVNHKDVDLIKSLFAVSS